MIDFLGLGALVLFVLVFGFLLRRAWRIKNAALKWVGVVLTGLFTLVGLAVLVVALIGTYKLTAFPGNPPSALKAATAPEDIARGQRYANGCIGCHSSTGALPLDGSKDNFAQGGPPVGELYAPNLTPSGELKDWTDGEIIRAIREGIHKSGRPLLIMPAGTFHTMSDADVQAIVGYLRSQAPSQHTTLPTNVNVLAALFVGTGMFPTSAQPAITQPVTAPPAGVSAEYGKYLVSWVGCTDCHGLNLTGTPPNGLGPGGGPNLTRIVPKWTEADFVNLFRTGKKPEGGVLSADAMPWQDYNRAFTDLELEAIFAYIHGLPAQADMK